MIVNSLFRLPTLFLLIGLGAASVSAAPHANRLTHLDSNDPFHVHRDFPKLTTPQWVGEEGVEAVVTLGIDDMRGVGKYEDYLRPILERLKQIDGRAPVSIMTVRVNQDDPQLQTWLKEGLNIDVHTLTHPCPLLQKSNFMAAANVVHGGVDLLSGIPGNHPVAFRMPCCDSMNSPSPRFYAEIFNRVNPAGQFLSIDTSVFNITSTNDPALPRELVVDAGGRERFRKYLPLDPPGPGKRDMSSFATTIEDYPYPYVIGKLCWEFPPMVPSDWEAFNLHGRTNAVTVADFKASLDVAVAKQGTYNLVFHPHGWIRNDQIVELIDYAVSKYGRKVKFLNFREALERLNANLLKGKALRAANGQDHGARLLDLNGDGHMDVVFGDGTEAFTRIWEPERSAWRDVRSPLQLVKTGADGTRVEAGVRFGIVRKDGRVTALRRDENVSEAWTFDGNRWVEDPALLAGLQIEGKAVLVSEGGRDRGVRFRDVDHNGRCELIVGNESQNAVFAWSDQEKQWKPLSFGLPPGTSIVDGLGRDIGLRFVDVNKDGFEDVVFSNEKTWSLHLWVAKPVPRLGWFAGWSHNSRSGKRGDPGEIPMIVRAGDARNNGAWFHSDHMWVQNEDTAHLPDVVDRRSFEDLLSFPVPAAKSPEEALKAFSVAEGFEVQLVAAEPLVKDPIAFDWGVDGRMWVVEMGDYPNGVYGKQKPGGVIRFLTDSDGDGAYDQSTVFMDGVNFPTGVMEWRKGVLVSAAPEIFYAEDTDGDGRADVRKTLFTGFKEGNQQHRVNGFQYGLDNWIYGANGDSGGNVSLVESLNGTKGGKPVNINGRDFRFNPDTGEFQAIAGRTQFGRNRDDWGNWFGNNNPNWLWHYHLPERYLARNPHLAVGSTKDMLASYPDAKRCYPTSKTITRWNQPHSANFVTSGCSPTPYRSDLFGDGSDRWVFVSEPVHNLIHREVIVPKGAALTSRRHPADDEREFLASSDNWFRPTMIKTGPDGALYLADMYRFVIEHPEWISPEAQAAVDVRMGDDLGRIYRVVPKGAKPEVFRGLKADDDGALIAALQSPHGWVRDKAQQLLVDRASAGVAVKLAKAFSSAKSEKARMQMLGALEGVGGLNPKILRAAFLDPTPEVRLRAVEVSEAVKGEILVELLPALLKLERDPSMAVRQQLAYLLGATKDRGAGETLGRMALEHGDDPNLMAAILSSAMPHLEAMVAAVVDRDNEKKPSGELMEKLLGMAVAAKRHLAVRAALEVVSNSGPGAMESWKLQAAVGFVNALASRGMTLAQFDESVKGDGRMRRALADLTFVFAVARRLAEDDDSAPRDRGVALQLLGRDSGDLDSDMGILSNLLDARHAIDLQRGALRSLRGIRSSKVPEILLAGWSRYSPAIRGEVLDVLMGRGDWLNKLLDAIEKGGVPAAQIGVAQRQKLSGHRNAQIRARAGKLFSSIGADRAAVIQMFEPVNRLVGDANRGRDLFRTACAVCHRHGNEGNEIGPDLASVSGKSVPELLVAILDPNAAVEDKFVGYSATLTGGREVAGIIASESPTTLVFKTAAGTTETVLRKDLQELRATGLSLMPEGFEAALNPQAMADLISYVAGGAGKAAE